MRHVELKALAIALAFLAPPALADDAHHPEKATLPAAAPAAATDQASAPKAAAKPAEALPADRARAPLGKARELMARIQQSRDPAEKEKLMHEHMQAMREGMAMMREMGSGMMMGMPSAAAMKDCGMMSGHAQMERRLDAMQQMMEQMLEHEAARDARQRP